jgi:chemotaxis protein CheZ
MAAVEKEDLDDLVNLVKQVMMDVAALASSDHKEDGIKNSRQALQTFHTTASMLGLHELERIGVELETSLTGIFGQSDSVDRESFSSFAFALDTLLEEMGRLSDNNGQPSFDSDRVMDTLHAASSSQTETTGELTPEEFPLDFQEPQVRTGAEGLDDTRPSEAVAAASQPADFTRLHRIVNSLGGLLSVNNDAGGSFQLTFPLSTSIVEKIESVLSPCDPDVQFAAGLGQQDGRLKTVLSTIKEFMVAFSTGDLMRSQDILLNMAEQQHQAGLYKEIGALARELHNSLRGFMDTMDPTLKELVEDKIPDSGSRLEHILQLTENAANTTLDHVEAMQMRNQDDQKKLLKVQEIMGGIRAIGDTARVRVDEVLQLLAGLQSSTAETSNDLTTILTAQDYQDLTGQIILKIIQLLKDLELKLVGVIRTFGVRVDGRKQQAPSAIEELYGPAHKGLTEALHSQDDVDSLLADFGF